MNKLDSGTLMTSSMFFKNTRQHSKEDHEVTRARIYVFQNNTNDHYKSKLLKVPTKKKKILTAKNKKEGLTSLEDRTVTCETARFHGGEC